MPRCGRRCRTPGSMASSGKVWPGLTRSRPVLCSSTSTRIVRARSAALMPVVMPWAASTDSRKAVPKWSPLPRIAMRARPRRSTTARVTATQIKPRPCLAMKLTLRASIKSAAPTRSPSFSRFSSSVTMTNSPRPMAAMTSSTGSNIPPSPSQRKSARGEFPDAATTHREISFHPDCTVGRGVPPRRSRPASSAGSRGLSPPVGNCPAAQDAPCPEDLPLYTPAYLAAQGIFRSSRVVIRSAT